MKYFFSLFLLLFPFVLYGQSVHISSSTDTICAGVSVTFTAVVTGVGTPHFRWLVNGSDIHNDSAHLVIATLANADTLYCQVINAAGDSVFATSDKLGVTVSPQPDAGVITGADSICVGASVFYTATVAGGGWNSNDYLVSVTSTGVVTGLRAATYSFQSFDTISYIVTNVCGADTVSKSIFVEAQPSAGFFLRLPYENDNSMCDGEILIISAGGELHFDILYSKYGKVEVSVATVRAISPGNDVLVAVDVNYCGIDTFVHSMTIYPLPKPGTITAIKQSICPGESTLVIADTTGASAGTTWSVSNNKVTIDKYGLVTGVEAGQSIIYCRFSDGTCGYAEKSITITVDGPAPIENDTSVCIGGSLQLTDSYAGGMWTSIDTDKIAIDATTGIITGKQEGRANVAYQLGRCKVQSSVFVNPDPSPITGDAIICVGAPVTLHNSGGRWSSHDSVLALQSQHLGVFTAQPKGITTITYTLPTGCSTSKTVTAVNCEANAAAFPDPFRSELVIQCDTELYHTFTIIDLYGRVVVSGKIDLPLTVLNTAVLPKGIFVLTLYGDDKLLWHQKIIKD